MKEKIHPQYGKSTATCTCGNTFETGSTEPKIQVEICSACHPFYTGKKKLVDEAGRVERFAKILAKTENLNKGKNKKKKKLKIIKKSPAKKVKKIKKSKA